jgi:DNA-binding MarR family transcriptional regulator
VLLDIDEHGQVTMGQLASHLRLDQSTLSRTVDGLVRKKLVERLQDDLDRRVVLIKLTTEGDSLCQEIHSNNDQFSRGVFEKIPPNEREIVIRGFEMLVQAYQDHET